MGDTGPDGEGQAEGQARRARGESRYQNDEENEAPHQEATKP
jgi:hypothetical protein